MCRAMYMRLPVFVDGIFFSPAKNYNMTFPASQTKKKNYSLYPVGLHIRKRNTKIALRSVCCPFV